MQISIKLGYLTRTNTFVWVIRRAWNEARANMAVQVIYSGDDLQRIDRLELIMT